MKPLPMSESEIRMRYRDGASAQILADLNACGWDRIKTIVGEPVEHKENKPRGHIDEKRARDLHAEGKTDKEMSIELGVSRGAVALWRSRRGFEANKREEIMIKETEPTEQDKPTETEMFFADVAPEAADNVVISKTETTRRKTPEDADCCPKCGGTGIVRQTNAARGIDIFTCPTCRGAGKKNTEDDFQEPTPKERCIAAGLNVVDVEPRTFLTSFFNNLMTGPDVERPTIETREQWEARRKDAIRTALIDALSKNGALPAEWVLEWNER